MAGTQDAARCFLVELVVRPPFFVHWQCCYMPNQSEDEQSIIDKSFRGHMFASLNSSVASLWFRSSNKSRQELQSCVELKTYLQMLCTSKRVRLL